MGKSLVKKHQQRAKGKSYELKFPLSSHVLHVGSFGPGKNLRGANMGSSSESEPGAQGLGEKFYTGGA